MHALFLLVLLVPLVLAQVDKKHVSQDPCAPKTTCHECIQTPTCAWCSEPWNMTDRVSCSAVVYISCDQFQMFTRIYLLKCLWRMVIQCYY